MPKVTLKSIFKRLDQDGDGRVSRAEVEAFARAAEIDSGLLGPIKLKGTVDAIMDAFDGDRDEHISFDEFCAKASTLLPVGLELDPDDGSDAVKQKVTAFTAMLDSKRTDGGIDEEELADHIEGKLREQHDPMAKMKAKVSAKMGVHTLDADGDGKIDAGELGSFAQDVIKKTPR